MAHALQWLELGGPIMWLLLALSIVAVTLVVAKFWDFRESQYGRRDFVLPALTAWEQHNPDVALSLLQTSGSPLAAAMTEAMKEIDQGVHSEAQIRERIERSAAARLESARSLLRPIELIAQLAPLLGLLGTVVGMIEAFQNLQAAGQRVDPSILSGGIWQALLTTAAGLGLAIPLMALHSMLERQVERLQQDMETALTRIFTRPAGAARAAGPRSSVESIKLS